MSETAVPADPLLRALPISGSLMLSETIAFMMPPLLAIGLVGLGENLMLAGIAAAAPALGVVVGIPLVPAIVRRLGSRLAFLVGAVLLMVAIAFYMLAEVIGAFPLWIIAGVVIGMGQAIRWIVADAAVARIADEGARGRLMSIHETLRSTAIGVGPAAVALADGNLRTGLLAAAGFSLLSLASSGAIPREHDVVRTRRRGPIGLLPLAASVSAFMGGTLESAAGASVPVYGLGLGLGAATAAALASASGFGNLATQVPIGMAMDRFGLDLTTRLVALATAASAAALPFCIVGAVSAPVLMFLFGGFAGALYTLAIVEATGEGADTTGVVAMIALLYTLGSFTGPILGNLAVMTLPLSGLPAMLVLGGVLVGLARFLDRPGRRRGGAA